MPVLTATLDGASPEVRREVLLELQRELWRRGQLEYLTRPGAQRSMYRRAHQQIERFPGIPEPLIYLCHRQLGKSHMSVMLCVERAIRQPGSFIGFGMDTIEHAHEIWHEKVPNVVEDMPPGFNYWTRKNFVYLRHKDWPRAVISTIALRGVDYQRGDGIRGGNYDMWVLDEVRNIHCLAYVVRHVITPAWRGAKDPLFLMLTTPPDTDDHDFLTYYRRAEKSGSLITIPASKNPDWSEDDDRMMLAEYGSKEDPGWQRELECRMIPNTDRLVIPEWGATNGRYFVSALPRPDYYRGYVFIDLGWRDHTAALFLYYDFENRRLGIIDEILVNYTPMDKIAVAVVEKLEGSFPEHVQGDVMIMADRGGTTAKDRDLEALNAALSELGAHDYWALPIEEKWDRDGAINALRSGISKGRVLVQQNCVMLDHTLKNAVWNTRRTDFERSKTIGHADLLAALNYAFRNIFWEDNPIPVETPRLSSTKAWIPEKTRTEEHEALLRAFGKGKR